MIHFSILKRRILIGTVFLGSAVFLGLVGLLLTATPVIAHHPLGGEAPKSLFEGLISGIGHPIIGPDHLAFVIAIGLLAARLRRGVTVPIAYLLAAVVGTGLHLAGLNLPALELVISVSVILFGLLVAVGRELSTPWIVALTSLVGMFHGYAYGEAVIGSEPTPLVAYLVGLTLVQGAIAGVTYQLAARSLNPNHAANSTAHSTSDWAKNQEATSSASSASSIRYAGFAIFGAGVAFLSNLIV